MFVWYFYYNTLLPTMESRINIHCFMLSAAELGHQLVMLRTEKRPLSVARHHTPFMLTTDKCLRMFHRMLTVGKTTLSIIAVSENLHENVLFSTEAWKESLGDRHRFAHNLTWWRGIYKELPRGLHSIAIEGRRDAELSSFIAVDDITIQPCEQFRSRNDFYYTTVNTYCNYSHALPVFKVACSCRLRCKCYFPSTIILC